MIKEKKKGQNLLVFEHLHRLKPSWLEYFLVTRITWITKVDKFIYEKKKKQKRLSILFSIRTQFAQFLFNNESKWEENFFKEFRKIIIQYRIHLQTEEIKEKRSLLNEKKKNQFSKFDERHNFYWSDFSDCSFAFES